MRDQGGLGACSQPAGKEYAKMKTLYITALVAIAALMITAGGAYACGNEKTDTGKIDQSQCVPASGQPDAYTAPVGAGPVVCPALMGSGPMTVEQDCGAQCAAGQVSPGWPYGWGDEYWLRPSSNL